MIKYIRSQTGAYVWEIDGIQLTLGFNKQVERKKYERYIREFKNTLLNCTYRTNPKILKSMFKYFGCVPFFRIGLDGFRETFLSMCHYYAGQYISENFHGSFRTIYKIPSFAYVLSLMVQIDKPLGVCSFGMLSTYNKEHKNILTQVMRDEFGGFFGKIITDALSVDFDLKDAAEKIGLTRVTQYCMDFALKLTEQKIRSIASGFTERRQVVSLFGVQKALWGDRKGHGYTKNLCDPRFKRLIETIVQDEINNQKIRFIKENHLEANIYNDVWNIYRMHGGNLALNRIDFSIIKSKSLRLEVKYCMLHRLNRDSRVNFVSSISYALNILSTKNPNINYVSDITEADARALYMHMETEYVTPHGNKLNVTTIGNIFAHCSYLCEYLMGDMRSNAIKSPRPYHNPFAQFRFVNLEAYKTNTAIIPEIVIEEIDRHTEDLNETHQLIYRIFSHTGMRMKEALFLKIDCIEPSRYDNLSQIKYTPYKVLSARRKAGLEDCHRVLVPTSLAADILEYAKKTQEYRNISGLPYIFLNAKYHGKINMSSMGSFVCAVNKLIKNYNICDENGKPWHFTTRQSRKTLAVTLIENGASTTELAYWLGHLASSTAMRYYAEVRQMKLVQLNTAFFKKQFNLLLSKQQLETFTEEERKLLYIDFRLERRRVEFGFCLLRPSNGECPVRHSLYNCVNCRHLCTGKKYLEYWQQLLDEQTAYLNELLQTYANSGISKYMNFKEYRKVKFLEDCYRNIIEAIKNGGGIS